MGRLFRVSLFRTQKNGPLRYKTSPWVSPSVARDSKGPAPVACVTLPPRLIRHRPGHKHSFAQAGRAEGFLTFPSQQLPCLSQQKGSKQQAPLCHAGEKKPDSRAPGPVLSRLGPRGVRLKAWDHRRMERQSRVDAMLERFSDLPPCVLLSQVSFHVLELFMCLFFGYYSLVDLLMFAFIIYLVKCIFFVHLAMSIFIPI